MAATVNSTPGAGAGAGNSHHQTPSGLTPSYRTPVPLASSVSRRLGGHPGTLDKSPRTPRVVLQRVIRVNDDEGERQRLRLQKNLCSMVSPGCHTPKGVASSGHKNKSHAAESSTSNLTNTQLAEHYANCMKLSSQNKISSKNAFGLHLIDHMLKLLKMRGEMTNFQIASSTLDAGAKIYAGRVDSIYNDIFKVLGGIGREHQDKEGEAGKEEGEAEDGDVEEGGKKGGKKRGKKSNRTPGIMIEKDPARLDGEFDCESRMDPLFQKTAAAFDEGGVVGLLLNNLIVQDDRCSLTLDASEKPVSTDEPVPGITIHLDEGIFDREALLTRQICPTFSNFKFNSQNMEVGNTPAPQNMEGSREGMSGGMEQGAADFTMLDCPPTAPDYGAEDDTMFGDAPALDADVDQSFNTATRGDATVLGVCSDNQVAQFAPASGAESEKSAAPLGLGGLGDLCLTDLIQPSDYSYFNPAVIASWAGPDHWKLRPRNAIKRPDQVKEVKTAAKRKKTVFKVDFSETPEKSQFASSKASTQLSKAALSKLDPTQNVLPRATHRDVDVLHSLFSQPKWKIKRKQKTAGVVDEGLEGDWYDYENANDQLNYCPPMEEGDEDGDDDDMMAMDETAPGFFCPSQEDEGADPLSQTAVPMETGGEGVELGGANLIAQPHKVDQIHVNFARSSKKIDVKRLKSKMWQLISQPQEQVDAGPGSSAGGSGVPFSSLCSELPQQVSSTMAKNLSVPICFVSLLHLANEKELRLSETNSSDLSDFNIFTS